MAKISKEELQFQAWADEAHDHGLVELVKFQPRTFELLPAQTVRVFKQLKTKRKLVDRHICQPHTYTPDFMLQLSDEGERLLAKIFEPSTLTEDYCQFQRVYIDTKGKITVQHGQSQMFSCNRKLVYAQHKIWVAKVVPSKLFKKTWCPEEFRWMKNRKVPTMTKMGAACNTAEDFIWGGK